MLEGIWYFRSSGWLLELPPNSPNSSPTSGTTPNPLSKTSVITDPAVAPPPLSLCLGSCASFYVLSGRCGGAVHLGAQGGGRVNRCAVCYLLRSRSALEASFPGRVLEPLKNFILCVAGHFSSLRENSLSRIANASTWRALNSAKSMFPSRRLKRNSSTRLWLSPVTNEFGHVQRTTSLRPHTGGPLSSSFGRQPSASAPRLQAGLSAHVALPSGLVGKMKVEGDDQFFRSAPVKPVSA